MNGLFLGQDAQSSCFRNSSAWSNYSQWLKYKNENLKAASGLNTRKGTEIQSMSGSATMDLPGSGSKCKFWESRLHLLQEKRAKGDLME